MEIGILDKSFICVIQPVIKALFGNADMTADSDAVEYTLFYQIISSVPSMLKKRTLTPKRINRSGPSI